MIFHIKVLRSCRLFPILQGVKLKHHHFCSLLHTLRSVHVVKAHLPAVGKCRWFGGRGSALGRGEIVPLVPVKVAAQTNRLQRGRDTHMTDCLNMV